MALKFFLGPTQGPPPAGVNQGNIEARAAKLARMEFRPLLTVHQVPRAAKRCNLREDFWSALKNSFSSIRCAKPSPSVWLVDGASRSRAAGFLDRTLPPITGRPHRCKPMPTNAIACFSTVNRPRRPKKISPPSWRKGVVGFEATPALGLTRCGDEGRPAFFGQHRGRRDGIDQPNFDSLRSSPTILVEPQNAKVPPPRSVATTQMIDAVANRRTANRSRDKKRPVGFQINPDQLIRTKTKKRSLSAKKAAGAHHRRPHTRKKTAKFLPCLPLRRGTWNRRARRFSIPCTGSREMLTRKLGREILPVREIFHLSDEPKGKTQFKRGLWTLRQLAGRKVRIPRPPPMGANFVFRRRFRRWAVCGLFWHGKPGFPLPC